MKEITSDRNPIIKNYIKIVEGKKNSKEEIKLPLEGFHLIEEALKKGVFIEQFFFAPEIAKPALLNAVLEKLPQATDKIAIPPSVLNKIAQAETPQGVAAVASYPHYRAEDIMSKDNLLTILVDGLQDPGNFGTIIRTAAAAGFDAVIYTPGTVKLNNPKVLRSTAGALFHINVLSSGFLNIFCNMLEKKDVSLIATQPRAKLKYFEADFKKSVLIIIGNENKGISDELLALKNTGISIPAKPGIDSINAAVAAGIVIYEACKQRL